MNLQNDLPFIIQGAGRIGTFSEAVYAKDSYPVQLVPQKFRASLKSGKTVYDISACFNPKSSQTLLRQFQKLMQA